MGGEFIYDFIAHMPQPGMAYRSDVTTRRNELQPGCTVYWYNITLRDDGSLSTEPANRIYQYEVGVKGANHATASLGPKHSSYKVRERVGQSATELMYHEIQQG